MGQASGPLTGRSRLWRGVHTPHVPSHHPKEPRIPELALSAMAALISCTGSSSSWQHIGQISSATALASAEDASLSICWASARRERHSPQDQLWVPPPAPACRATPTHAPRLPSVLTRPPPVLLLFAGGSSGWAVGPPSIAAAVPGGRGASPKVPRISLSTLLAGYRGCRLRRRRR